MTLDSDHPGTYAVSPSDRARWRAEEAAARLWSYVGPGLYRHTSGVEVVLTASRPAEWRVRRAGALSAGAWPTCEEAQTAALRPEPEPEWRPLPGRRGKATDATRLADELVAAGVADEAGALLIVQRYGGRTTHARQTMARARARAVDGPTLPDRIRAGLEQIGPCTVRQLAVYLDETSDAIGNLLSKEVATGRARIAGVEPTTGRGRPRKLYERTGA